MRGFVFGALVLLTASCGGTPEGEATAPSPAAAAVPTASASNSNAPVIVAFGDSLTAGYGVGVARSYPAFLEQELAARGVEFRVVNEGVSGDTTAAALVRVDSVIAEAPQWAIVALGANDGLRGLPVEETEKNLREIVGRLREAGSRVVLAGMKLPPNYGPDYVSSFEAIYPRLAKELDLPLIPFLLDGVAAEPQLNQSDGIHPNEQGNRIVARNVAAFLEPLLDER